MANTIKLKRNSTAGQVPSSLADGELAINTADEKLFIKNASGSIVEVQSSTAGGAPEGTAVLSTGETGGTKYLREDGDGTSSWQDVIGGGPSLGTDSVIRTNAQTISENITIPSTTNGMSIGDITVADGYTVTVNGRWVVI